MIVTLILRFFQLLFAAVVLGLSVTLIRDQVFDGSSPATINYAAFTGGFGFLAAIIGIVSIFVEPLSGLITAAVDALASLFYLAGGLAIVIILRGISCSSDSEDNYKKSLKNDLLNGGCISAQGDKECGYKYDFVHMRKRCKENETDAAFQFMSFALCIGCALLAFLAMKKGTGRKGVLV